MPLAVVTALAVPLLGCVPASGVAALAGTLCTYRRGRMARHRMTMACLLVLGAPASAIGATATTVGGCDKYGQCFYTVRVAAVPGETNHIRISNDANHVVLVDTANPVRAGRLCRQEDEHTIACQPDSAVV